MDKELSLRTGEHAEDGLGRERLRLFWEGDEVKIKVSFPMFNTETQQNFWMWSETTFNRGIAQDIIDYLDTWPNTNIQLNTGPESTGPNTSETISFTGEWIDSEKSPGKKIRVFIPVFGPEGKPRMALTKINFANKNLIIKFLRDFVKGEDISDNDENARLQRLVQELTDEVDVLSRKLAEEKAKNNPPQSKTRGNFKVKSSRPPLRIEPQPLPQTG